MADVRPLGNENPFTVNWIYPKKFGITKSDINNYVDAINNKMCTLQKFYAECYGEDWKPNIVQRISEESFIKSEAASQGVDMSTVLYGKATLSSKNQSDTDTVADSQNEKEPDEKE